MNKVEEIDHSNLHHFTNYACKIAVGGKFSNIFFMSLRVRILEIVEIEEYIF